MKLVISTTGFSQEDDAFLYLIPRSPNAQKRDVDSDNCIVRVGLELEPTDDCIQIILTG